MITILRACVCFGLASLLAACNPCRDGEDPSIDLDANGVADCAETLVRNSQITEGATSWTAGPDARIAGGGMDSKGAAGSASLQVTNTVMMNTPSTTSARQCVMLVSETQYVIAGQFYFAGNTIQGLGAQLRVQPFEQQACAGGALSPQVTDIDMTAGGWRTLQTNVLSGRAQSAYFEPAVRKSAGQGDATVLFDNLLIHAR